MQRLNHRLSERLERLARAARLPLRGLGGQLKPRLRLILFIALAAVFAFSAGMLALEYVRGSREERALKELAAIAEDSAKSPAPSPCGIPAASPLPAPEAPVILAQYRELYEQNPDMAGWIRVGGTAIDYPVMYTPKDGEFYLIHGFDRAESRSGVPFIDKRCTVEPFGTNTIIYGHHMKNGTMFAGLARYEDEDFCREHPVIRFDTLYAQQEYEIIAVFRSQIYKKSDPVFKHYNFLNAANETEFDTYIGNIKALSLYDTGTTAEYGDELITLVTCAYHTENGQFVVVARKIG